MLNRRTAEIQVAVFHPEVIASVGVVLDGKGGQDGRAQYLDGADLYLDITCGKLLVFAAPFPDFPFHLNHKFPSEGGCLFPDTGVCFFIGYQLGDTIPVAQVYESHSSQIPNPLNPAGQDYFRTAVFDP